MAKKPTKAQNEKGGYIDVRLTDEERQECRKYCVEAAELWEKVQQLVDSQMVFKVAIEPQNDCYACYISGHWRLNQIDARWTLTGRGSTWEKAVRQALYMHFEILGGDWSDAKAKAPTEKTWD